MRFFLVSLCLCLFLLCQAASGACAPSGGGRGAAARPIIVVDAGHGGRDPGTSHNGILERRLTLELARMLKKTLQKRGYRVRMTRNDNSTLSVAQRAEKAEAMKGRLLVSLHLNSNLDTEVRGLEVYHWRKESLPDAIFPGVRLAQAVHDGMTDLLQKRKISSMDGGVKSADFGLLRETSMPAVLVECAYVSNKKDAALLRRKDFRKALIEGIADGIDSYLERSRK